MTGVKDVANNMYKVLIVEDELIIQQTLKELLEKDGYIVEVVTDGESGLTKASSVYFDLIYTGIMMPKIDGLTFIKKLKSKKIKYGKLVVFSNLANPEVIKEAYNLGVDRYGILSELTPEQIAGIIDRIIHGSTS